MSSMKTEYLSVSEAARELGLSSQQIRRMADTGKLDMERTTLGRLVTAKSVAREKKQRMKAR